ncbi:uncharacterized protein TOT_040000233 [Theileria orientalis strain Shintoku]|uniref:Cns1/TTC4 wheel domain-containing protein n=1 Tax=Theileria orientalis strain Shintoku TaxID=869250 RepID=J4C936_THEOR|nr:uncharacterized protein TOT_040000233 [Theileria orientalis strain Shintoku]PVC52882.1 hypothetical protein MACL_00000463 [Theileria orientalis]BAM41853.1 uncharacterized protein TOT_040000233 [Theileria orientalis strain Shintoku]|eukprot:XP_009692154.1 uncharacterized protein TOT_040000233 [Theileria orientalis strain Shintoku]
MDDDDEYNISEEFLKELTEKYADIEHPLFMDELPSDMSANPDLEALHKLLAEGETRDSIAQKYKEVGNGYVADGKRFYEAAISSYTDGIAAESRDDVLNSQLYSNRALVYLRLGMISAIHFHLGEYVKCVNDCRHSIKFDKFNYKSYYRGSMASFNLSLYKQALLFCTECVKAIKSDPNMNVSGGENEDCYKLLSLVDVNFSAFYKKVLNKYTEFELEKRKRDQAEHEEKQMKASKESELTEYLKSKGLTLSEDLFKIPESQTVVFSLKDGTLHTSCLFVYVYDCCYSDTSFQFVHFYLSYDQMELSDYILDFDYATCIADHLEVMFANKALFNPSNSLCFYQVSEYDVMKFDVNEPFESVVFKSHLVFKVPVVHIVTSTDSLRQYTVI